LWCASGVWAQTALWLCPGNLFTNQLDAPQARARACTPAALGGLSQAMPASADGALAMVTARSGAVEAVSAVQVEPAPIAVVSTGAPRSGAAVWTQANPVQQRRDAEARHILELELERVQSQLRALQARADTPPEAAVLRRLQVDEAALLRELSRLGR
jgi:hypothetical protein